MQVELSAIPTPRRPNDSRILEGRFTSLKCVMVNLLLPTPAQNLTFVDVTQGNGGVPIDSVN